VTRAIFVVVEALGAAALETCGAARGAVVEAFGDAEGFGDTDGVPAVALGVGAGWNVPHEGWLYPPVLSR
jgi:hypothetical protein